MLSYWLDELVRRVVNVMIIEVDVIDGSEGGWIDTRALHHVCHDLSLLKNL